ncbi:MAG: GTP-binding protein [Gammaproteobacteria bacterium]|nr:MAG: GTP-binding protein [Gammaproteobacteria bacterium]
MEQFWKSVQSTVNEAWDKISFWQDHSEKQLDLSPDSGDDLSKSLSKTQSDLDRLLNDRQLSRQSREILAEDSRQLNRIIDKLENKQYHIAVFGRVSVGKSSLLNTLLGRAHFSTSVLHGETKETADIHWTSYQDRALQFVDTPGIDEFDGKVREDIAKQAVSTADMVLFVVDGDLTQIEYDALRQAKSQVKSLIVAVNKADRLSQRDIDDIRNSISDKLATISSAYIPLVFVAADPRAKEIIRVDASGRETLEKIVPASHVDELKAQIWQQLKQSGHQLQALSAAVFATQISDKIGEEIVRARADIAANIIQKYCIGKALAVGLNPVPLLDVSVIVGDIAMIKHLGSVYGFDINRREATVLLKSVITELGLVLGTSFGMQALSSVLKGISAGLSTVLTASVQGVAAYYATYLVGRACEEYFKKGAGWGADGAGKVLQDMLDDIDKDTVLAEAKADIQRVLRSKSI